MSGDCIITLLARDPYWLYVYWDISEEKGRAFMSELGEELWRRSAPSLKVINITRNESFFVRINEFSDNWYINVRYPDNVYMVEIGRKISDNFFVGFQSSNSAVTPGNHASPYTSASFANYAEVKSGQFEIRPDGPYLYGGARDISGPGSQEFYGTYPEEGMYGVSSAEQYDIYGQKLSDDGPDGFGKGGCI